MVAVGDSDMALVLGALSSIVGGCEWLAVEVGVGDW